MNGAMSVKMQSITQVKPITKEIENRIRKKNETVYVNNEIIQIDKQIRRRRDVIQHSFIVTVKS